MRRVRWLLCIAVLASPCRSEGPQFEAVSVKMADMSSEPPRGPTIVGGPGTSDPGKFLATHITMLGLVYTAFGVRVDQIAAPSWVTDFPPTRFYSFNATMSPATTRKQFEQMLQNALIEYFHMAVHHETHKRLGYSLTVDAGGPKLQEVRSDPSSDDAPGTSPSKPLGRGPDGFITMPASPRLISTTVEGGRRAKYQGWTMDKFADNLPFMIAPAGPTPRVSNETGLSGAYTFTLEFSCADCSASRSAPKTDTLQNSNFPDISTAVRKQLGLRLRRTDDVSVDVIVVDSLDKVPVRN